MASLGHNELKLDSVVYFVFVSMQWTGNMGLHSFNADKLEMYIYIEIVTNNQWLLSRIHINLSFSLLNVVIHWYFTLEICGRNACWSHSFILDCMSTPCEKRCQLNSVQLTSQFCHSRQMGVQERVLRYIWQNLHVGLGIKSLNLDVWPYTIFITAPILTFPTTDFSDTDIPSYWLLCYNDQLSL